MNESELYKELGIITRDRDKWEDSISYVSSLLTYESVKIQAKALWLLGEIGLAYPLAVQDKVPLIASFCKSPVSLLRERAVNALGRIGRGNYHVIEAYWSTLFHFAADEAKQVRGPVALAIDGFILTILMYVHLVQHLLALQRCQHIVQVG